MLNLGLLKLKEFRIKEKFSIRNFKKKISYQMFADED